MERDYTLPGCVPKPFVIPWTGRNMKEDDILYESSPSELNDSVCATCGWHFSLDYNSDSHNTFASLLHRMNDKEDDTLWWKPACSECLDWSYKNENMQWPELNGWFINWSEAFGWDAIWYVVNYNDKLPDDLAALVALRVFHFLAVRGECFPAQNSKSEEDIKREQQEREERERQWKRRYVEDRYTQSSMTSYYKTTEPPNKKPKPVKPPPPKQDPLQSKTLMRKLVNISSNVPGWLDFCCTDKRWRLEHKTAVVITITQSAGCMTMNIWPHVIEKHEDVFYHFYRQDANLVAYCVDTSYSKPVSVWSMYCSKTKPCEKTEEPHVFQRLLTRLLAMNVPHFQKTNMTEKRCFGCAEHLMLILHSYQFYPQVAKECVRWREDDVYECDKPTT